MTVAEFVERIEREQREQHDRHEFKLLKGGSSTKRRSPRRDLRLPAEYVDFLNRMNGAILEDGALELLPTKEIGPARATIMDDNQEYEEVAGSWIRIAIDGDGEWVIVWDTKARQYHQVALLGFDVMLSFSSLDDLLTWVATEILLEDEGVGLAQTKGLPSLEKVTEVQAHPSKAFCVALSADGRQAFTGANAIHRGYREHGESVPPEPGDIARIWNANKAELISNISIPDGRYVQHIAPSPNGQFLALVDRSGNLWILRLPSLELLCHVQSRTPIIVKGKKAIESRHRHKPAMSAIAVSPDSRAIVGYYEDGSVPVYDVDENGVITGPMFWPGWGEKILDGHGSRQLEGTILTPEAMMFTPDGKYVIAAGADRRPIMWEFESGARVREFEETRSLIHAACLVPQSRLLVCVEESARHATVWDIDSGKIAKQIGQHDSRGKGIWSVACTPDGKTLLTGGRDGYLKTWDLKTGKELASVQASLDAPCVGCTGSAVSGIAVLPDGKHILNTGWDGMLRMWRLPGGGG